MPWPTRSTADPAKRSAGEHRRKNSTDIYSQINKPVLRRPVEPGQFSSWAFSERVRQAGLAPSMGTVGDAFDNAMIEAFWARLQTELLNRKKWKTRLELTAALFDYLEIFHNRTRRHSSLGMLTPIEYERLHSEAANAA